MRAEIEQL